MKIKGLIFFDIDGTLTRGVNSGTFIADRLGIGEQMRAAEEAYARGEMDNAAVCRVDAAGYAGLPVSMVESWLDDMPLIDGIAPALTVCRAAGFVPYAASCTWSYIGAYLARRFGFVGWCGPELEVVDGMFTGRVAHDADERAKPAFARERAAALGVDLASCLAVGDSRSDIPLFQTVGPRWLSMLPMRPALQHLMRGTVRTLPRRSSSSWGKRRVKAGAACCTRIPPLSLCRLVCGFSARYRACAAIAFRSQAAQPATLPS